MLLWTAMIISPGLRATFYGRKAARVLVEWSMGPEGNESYEALQVRLKKDPSKAYLFQELCELLKPL